MRSSNPIPTPIIRQNSGSKQPALRSLGVVDLHFHGAFGVDLMVATEKELDTLSEKLWEHGVAAFCPTTLSDSPEHLRSAVQRLGSWIVKSRSRTKNFGAIPLGIHLEGPFIHPEACGAHPPKTIRPLTLSELDSLWKASQRTLKILTFAPELLSKEELSRLVRWAKARKIVLSLGHSRATTEQAARAFELGIQGVTHAWNALSFHHRSPGPLGAALGRNDTYVELIIDQLHVDPVLIRWTQRLHPVQKICYVSDCAPAAATQGKWFSFGPLQVTHSQGACRTQGGALAGGGLLLSQAYANWVQSEARSQKRTIRDVFSKTIVGVTEAPLAALGLSKSEVPGLKSKKIQWFFDENAAKPKKKRSAKPL